MPAHASGSWSHALAFSFGILCLVVGCHSSAGPHEVVADGGGAGSGGLSLGGSAGIGGTTVPSYSDAGAGGGTTAGSGGVSDAARDRGGADSQVAQVDAVVDVASDRIEVVPDGASVAGREAGSERPGMPEAGVPPDATGLTTLSYVNDPNTIFANPERGFYQVNEVTTSSWQALSQSWLQNLRTQNGVSLVFQMIYLDKFASADLSQSFLDALSADFTTMRKAGVKAVVRFAYTANSTKPYGDANKTRVLGHIKQLKAVLFANSDVIAVLQAGFIGAWGEWYYTDFFGDNGTISASQWSDRQEVVNALLDALDLGRPIQLRTPAFKQHFYGATALTSTEAFTGVAKARVGHHNDCFLASADDQGTYNNVTTDKAYLVQENLYLPQGGETCAPSSFSNWSNAQTDMSNLHWSFLNSAYHPDVLASWGTNIDIAKRRLGYRLSLEAGTYATQVPAGSAFDVQLAMRNDGFAPPFGPRELNLILRGAGSSYVAKLPDDPRRFLPGSSSTIARSICLPPTASAGAYALLLALADPVPALSARPEYAIRLANQGLWEAATGYNDLKHNLLVTAADVGPACGPNAIAAVALP